MQTIVLQKLKYLISTGDNLLLDSSLALSPAEWELLDLILLHSDADELLVSDVSTPPAPAC
ncbi:hypothetical protein F3G60_35195, partial [Pseudomonas aeruginosa]